MKVGSLFSGAGGLDLAVQAVFGGEVAWHCENDAAASKVLAARWAGVPNYGDLRNVAWGSWKAHSIDVLCAGWPCQPFSLAGKRKGIDDDRALWPQVARAIRILRPRYVVLENVAAVLRSPEFDRVANSLAGNGYRFSWTCLRASDVGAPHRRERVFVVASDTAIESRGVGNGDDVRARCGAGRHTQTAGRSGDAAYAACDGRHEGRAGTSGIVGGPDAAQRGDGAVELLPTPRASDGLGGNNPLSRPERQDDIGTRIARLLCDYALLLATPSSADGGGGHLNRSGARRDELLLPGQAREMASAWGKYEPAIAAWENVTRPAPAPTEPNRNGNPRLNPAFSEWMMGWPAGWVTQVGGISRNDQLRIIGNGVVPQQAEAAIRWLLNIGCEVVA